MEFGYLRVLRHAAGRQAFQIAEGSGTGLCPTADDLLQGSGNNLICKNHWLTNMINSFMIVSLPAAARYDQ